MHDGAGNNKEVGSGRGSRDLAAATPGDAVAAPTGEEGKRPGGAGGQGGGVLIEAEVAGSSGSRCAKQWTAPSSYVATEHGGAELQGTGDGSGVAHRIWHARGSGGHHDAGVLL